MTLPNITWDAVCFKCGARKPGALHHCPACGVAPAVIDVVPGELGGELPLSTPVFRVRSMEASLSLALSNCLSNDAQLDAYAIIIKTGRQADISQHTLSIATEALLDASVGTAISDMPYPESAREAERIAREILNKLSVEIDVDEKSTELRPWAGPHESHDLSDHNGIPKYLLANSRLHNSPFWILGATVRDNASHILDLAEIKSLEFDDETCQRSSTDLTNPRTRLSAEMAWLPGVSPNRSAECLKALSHDSMSVRNRETIPTLASLNLWAAAIESIEKDHSTEDLMNFIVEFCHASDRLDADEIMRHINEDRTVSGFSLIQDITQIEDEIVERRKHYRAAIKECLNKFTSHEIIFMLTMILERVTHGGEFPAPNLLDELADTYEAEVQQALEIEGENIQSLIDCAISVSENGEKFTTPIIEKIIQVAHNWVAIAKPIQLSAKSRGITHFASVRIANDIRSLGVNLYNIHHMLVPAEIMTKELLKLFSNVPDVIEALGDDADTIDNLAKTRAELEEHMTRWEEQISCEVHIGGVVENTFKISPSGISLRDVIYPLDSITRVRWGGVRRLNNGIPSGAEFTIAFGDNNSESIISTRNSEIYKIASDKIFIAVGSRLYRDILETLQSGSPIMFGDVTVYDNTILLTKHRFLSSVDEEYTWSNIYTQSISGELWIRAVDDERTFCTLSYIDVANVHILEWIIQERILADSGERKPLLSNCKLSDLLI